MGSGYLPGLPAEAVKGARVGLTEATAAQAGKLLGGLNSGLCVRIFVLLSGAGKLSLGLCPSEIEGILNEDLYRVSQAAQKMQRAGLLVSVKTWKVRTYRVSPAARLANAWLLLAINSLAAGS